MKGLKAQGFLCLSLLLVCLSGALALGTLHADLITPLTQDYVSIPSLAADLLVATTTKATNLRGDFPEGFNINAVGGISFHSLGDHSVSVPGDISYSAPVSGDAALFGKDVEIHATDDVNVWAATQGILRVSNDLNLYTINGDFKIQSYLSTSVDAIDGIAIGSLHRETRISAAKGTMEVNSDIVSFTSGDIDEYGSPAFFLLSNDTIDIRATKTFLIDSNTINMTAFQDLTIQSDVHNVEFEARQVLSVSASSNVILKSISNTYFEALLDDFVASSNGVISFYAHGTFFYGKSIFLDSDNDVRFDSAGNIKFSESTGTSIDASEIDLESQYVKWTATSGNINVNVDVLNIFSDNIFFTTSHVPGAKVNVLSNGQVSFETTDSDVRFESFYSSVRSGTNIDLNADSDIFLIGVRHSNQANLLSPDGFSTYSADKDLSISGNQVFFQSNGGVVIDDDTSVTFGAVNTLTVTSWNFFLQSSTNQITYSAPNATYSAFDTSYSSEAISISAANIASYSNRKFYAVGNSDKMAPLQSTTVGVSLTSSEAGLDIGAQTVAVSGTSINFSNNNQDNQEFNVDAANSLTFTTPGSLSYQAGTGSINLLAPTGSIQARTGGNTNFGGNSGVFKSITGDMTFDATITGFATNINLRAGELISWNGKGQPFTVSAANTINFDSGVGIGLVSSTLLLSNPTGNTNFYADYNTYVLGQGNVTLVAKNIHAQGGDVVLESQKQANFFISGTSTISSANLHDITLKTNNFVTKATNGSIYETAPYFYGTFSGAMSLTTSAVSFTSNLDNDISFISTTAGFSVLGSGAFKFVADSFNSTSPLGTFQVNSTNFNTFSAYYGTVTAGNSITFSSSKDLTIVSKDMSIYLKSFQFDKSDITISGTSNTDACTGDYRVKSGGTYSYYSAGTIPVYQQINPCNSPCSGSLCTPDHFDIVSRSNRTQTMQTNQVTYNSNHAININGGDLLFRTTDSKSSINMTTTNGVTIASKNYPNYLTYNPDDNLYAGNNLNITINGAAHFEADGYDDNAAYPNYGILMETSINPLYSFNTNYTIKVPNGEINEYAYKLLRIATLQPLDNTAATLSPQAPGFLGQRQDFTVAVTRDVLFDGGVGSITAISGGNLLTDDDDAVASDSGMTFLAAVGDITATAKSAQMIFKDKYLFSVLSQADSVFFTSTFDQAHSSQRKDGNMLYHSEFGLMNFNDKLDTSIIAGTVTEDASITASASNQIIITSGQNQVYHATGANIDATGIAINIIGDEGDIIAQTPSSIEFDSAARVEISAQTGVLTLTMNDNIDFYADGRIDYVSQFTSNFTVLNGDLDFNANGGGGSLSINSDDGQDITGVAGKAIKVTAAANNEIYAINGISVLSHTGDISLSNEGVDNDMFYLSQGSVSIKAQDVAGVSIYGYSYHIDAFQDVSFDTALFTVDSTSAQTTSTEPVIEIHAGGDVSIAGIVVTSIGGMEWTTSEAAGVHISGDKVEISAGVDIKMNTNGPILFENKGAQDVALFTINSNTGSFNMNGDQEAIIDGLSLVDITTTGFILLKTTANDAGDGISIRTERDLEIDTATFSLLTSSLEGEVRSWDVTAANQISIVNTVGDGGSLTFDSDLSLDLLSVGPVLITSSGEATIRTIGEDSDINFSAAGSVTLNSGESTFFQSNNLVAHSSAGLTFNSTGGLMQFTASNDATFASNSTFNLLSRSNIDITTNDIASVLRITATGDESFVSTNDLSIDSTNGTLYAVADSELLIDNRIPTRPRDQGDIYITSYGDLFFGAGGDVTQIANTGVYSATVDGTSRITSYGDVTLTAQDPGASIDLLAQDGPFRVYAGDTLLFGVGLSTGVANPSASLIVQSTKNVTWAQDYEEGFGGISVSSFGGVLSVNSGGNTLYGAEGSVTISANDYVSFFSVDRMNISCPVDEADAIFQTNNADVIIHAGTTFSYQTAYDEARVIIQGFADQTPGDSLNSVYIESTADAITYNTTFFEGNVVSTSGGATIFQNADLPGLDIIAQSTGAINIVATGIDPTKTYGVYMETDDSITFSATASRNLIFIENSFAVFNGSENFNVLSNSRVDFVSGDDFLVYTGFTPQPNANLLQREGISITATNDVLFSSVYNDVNIQSEDASWSLSSSLFLRSSATGGSVSFFAPSRPINMRFTNADFRATDLQAFASSNLHLFSTGNNGAVRVSAKKELFIFGSTMSVATTGNPISISSNSGDIRFFTPKGTVGANQRPFLIPVLQNQAGMSQNLNGYPENAFLNPFINNYLTNNFKIQQDYVHVESQYPGCQERSFGFDEISQTICYCDFNKWRCAPTFGNAYATALNNFYNGNVIINSSPNLAY